MGVSLEVWRSCIGTYNGACCNALSLNSYINHVRECGTGIAMSLLLINVLLFMGCVEANPGPLTARCPLCNFKLQSLAGYIHHMIIGHSTTANPAIPCYSCGESFRTAASFRTHHDRFHSAEITQEEPAAHVVGELLSNNHNFVCSEDTCGESLQTAKALRVHMVKHLRNGYVILCPFQPCKNRFTKVTTFRTHCSQRHRVVQVHVPSPKLQAKHKTLEVQPQHQAPNIQAAPHQDREVQAPAEDLSCVDFADFSDSDSDSSEPELSEEEENESVDFESREDHTSDAELGYSDIFPGNMIRDRVGKFYLMLEGTLLLSTNTIQKLSEEITYLLDMSHHRIKVAMREELMKEGISSQKAKEVIDKALKKDTVYATHHKGMDSTYFGSDHMRNKFFKEKFSMLSPEEIPLGKDDGGKERFAHYIRFQDTLEMLFNDPSVQKDIDDSFNRTSKPGIYTDIRDGSLHKNHPICGNMDCIELILYQDAFDFFPLSPSSGIYKCVGFYFTLGNIDPSKRSKVDAIQLALLVRERDLKYFTIDKVLERLVNELIQLGTTGIQYKNRKLPVVVTQVCGDNLGQNFLGKYIECFSHDHYCRFCKVTKENILKKPDFVSPFRTPEEYDRLADQFDPHQPQVHKEGLRGHSILNRLPFFHVSKPGQPPCIAHDILEGVGKEDVALCLRYFIDVRKWFTLETLNRRIANFKTQERDSRDSLVKLDASLSKIRGHASEVWLFIRMLPFLVGDLIPDKDDEVWQVCLKLKVICEYVFSPRISDKQVAKLKALISLYVEIRAALFTKNLLPKHHFMCHYADLTAMCGNLIRLWTMRFESRHIFFKRVGKVANNFKNITYTLVNKYVYNFAFKLTTPLFPPPISFRGEDAHTFSIDELKPEVQDLLKSDPTFTRSLDKVSVNSITYTPGLWVILGCRGKDLVVGEILLLLFNGENLKFIVKSHEAHNSFQGYYQISHEGGTISAVMQDCLEDYYPLPAYHFKNNLCISLKHSTPAMD